MRCFVPALALAAVPGPVSGQVDLAVAFSTADAVRVGDAVYPYRLLAPAAALRTAPLPLVVFLHGAGERGDDNRRQLTWLPSVLAAPTARAALPCWLLAVQCPAGEQWVDVPWGETVSRPQPVEPSRALQAVLAAMDRVLADPQVDGARVYLTGLSMGGYGAFDLATRCPERFAAVLAVCGGGDERRAAQLLAMPLRVVHGADDPVVPVERSRAMVAAVRALGGIVGYDELPGVQHDSWRQAYGERGALRWLFAQDQRQQGRVRPLPPPLVPLPRIAVGAAGQPAFAPTAGIRIVADAAASAAREALAAALAVDAPQLVDAALPRTGEVVLRLQPAAADWCRIEVANTILLVGRDPEALRIGAGHVASLLQAGPGAAIAAAVCVHPRPLREGWIVVVGERPWTLAQCRGLLRRAFGTGYRGIAGIAALGLRAEDEAQVRAAAAGYGLAVAAEPPAGAVRFRGGTDAAAWLAAACPGDGPFAVEVAVVGQDADATVAVAAVRLGLAAERAAHPDAVLHTNAVLARLAAMLRR